MAMPVESPSRAAPRVQRRRWSWRRILLIGLLSLVGMLVAVVGTVYSLAVATVRPLTPAPVLAEATRFDGRYLLAASDADMVASAYADGQLLQVPGDTDTLSLIQLPLTDASAPVIAAPASNSVTSWPQIVAVAPDGSAIYMVEIAQPIDDAVTQLPISAIPSGRLLTVIEPGANRTPPRTRTVDVGEGPSHVAISSDGAYLAVGLREPGRQLAILPTATLDDPGTFRSFPVERANGTPADEVTSVFWHPSGQFLGVGISAEEIQFYRVMAGADGLPTVTPHGERATGGYTFSYGQFTRDGRFYLTSEINWDRYPPPLRNLINPPSELVLIRFDTSDAGQHAEVSRVPVGLSAEGFAVSPQEDLVVAVNMGRTYLPDRLAFWPGAQLSSLSLLRFDNQTGALELVGEPYAFDGVLPEDAMFDADGDSLGVVIYNFRERPLDPSVVEFWNVVRAGDTPRLERTAVQVPLVRGAHAMNLIP